MLWPAGELFSKYCHESECQQAPWPDAHFWMPDSQIRHAGYILTFDEHLTNYAISTSCNYQEVEQRKREIL